MAEKYGQDNPFDIFDDVLADIISDVGHKRLTRWSLNRLNVEMESWTVVQEFEKQSKAYHEMTGGNDVAACFDFQDFLGHDFFTPLDAEWEEDINGSP